MPGAAWAFRRLIRTGSCGASGFALIVSARSHSFVCASASAAASAPTKFGIRSSGDGKRAMPFSLIACHYLFAQRGLRREHVPRAGGIVVVTARHGVKVACGE
jgi:hypothetical protein